MPYKVRLKVLSFINLGRHRPGEEIVVEKFDPADARYELIEEVKEAAKPAKAGKGKAPASPEFE